MTNGSVVLGGKVRAHARSASSAHLNVPHPKNKRLHHGLAILLVSSLAWCSSAHAACLTASAAWQNISMPEMTKNIDVYFEASPGSAGADGVMGLSNGPANQYTQLAAIVRFNTNNTIDARDGNVYKADKVLYYTPGAFYSFRIALDFGTRAYSVYVVPPNGTEQLIANNYKFRTERSSASLLNNFAACASIGSVQVCDVAAAAVNHNSPPVAKLTASPGSGIAPVTIEFDGSSSSDSDGTITSYAWNFSDGVTGSGVKYSRTFSNPGSYLAILTVTDDGGATATAMKGIAILSNQPPNAVISTNVTSGPAPLSVSFDGSGCTDPDGTISSYAWNFGDGTTGTGAKVTHVYNTAGTYAATLTVTDNAGATATATTNITATLPPSCVNSTAAWQNFSMTPFNDLVSVEFDATPQAAGLDGLVCLSQAPGTTYSAFAAIVRFSVDNRIDARNGNVYAATAAVPYTPGIKYHFRVVADVPARSYSAYVTSAGGQEIQIAANYAFRTEQQSITSIANWAAQSGSSAVQVCNMSAKAVARNKPPVAVANVTPTSGTAPLTIQATATGSSDPDGSITKYLWDCGDGTPVHDSASVSHTYTAPGTYTAKLTVTDNAGATDTKSVTINVTAPAGACVTSSTAWQNYPMTSQTGAFSFEFDATPNAANMDGGIMLSSAAVADFSNGALAIRFSSSGQIDALNGSGYASDTAVAYTPGTSYRFYVTVSVPSRSYSVYVTPAGSTQRTVGSNYSFRTSQSNVTSLSNWATWSSVSTLQVCNFKLGPAPAPALVVSTKNLDFGASATNLGFEVWNSGGSTLSYTIADDATWLSVTPTSGQSTGQRNTITATVNRTGLAAGTYQGKITVTPSVGAAITIAVTMQYAQVPQTQLKPIARWDVVPYTRINQNSTFNCGVVAFSKFGIDRVRFTITGQGYKGPSPVDVTSMSLNEQSGVWEYWTPISASNFTSNGVFTVEATVYGLDGGIRNKSTDGGGLGLDALPLVVNATGALAAPEIWVSTGGNDSTGTVNDSTRPCATIGRAIDKIRAWRSAQGLGNNADGGIVRLMSGTHYANSGGISSAIACDTQWVTITTASGGTKSNTVIASGGIMAVRKLCIRGVTLQGSGVLAMPDRGNSWVWADNCTLVGSGMGNANGHPLGYEYGRLYYTGTSISQVAQATNAATLCRGMTITNISDDAFQNVPMVINCTVDNINPLNTGAHADVWQHHSGNTSNRRDDNVIVYGLKATNVAYQTLFIRADINSPASYAQGMAFVNVYMAMNSNGFGYAGWYRWVDHLLWWNCSFPVKGLGFAADTYAGVKRDCSIRNFSCKGTTFAFLTISGSDSGIDWSDWKFNHFVNSSITRGTNFTTGNEMLDSSGIPMAGSPLLDRFTPVVPVDARNKVRTGLADVGAFER